MTSEEKIAGAAEIICTEIRRQGGHISIDVAAQLARQLYHFWHGPQNISSMRPGDIAQHLRERYDGTPPPDDVSRASTY